MDCQSCGHPNGEMARFCAQCAAPLARNCAVCDAPLQAGARFCDQCATPVDGAASDDGGPSSRPLVASRKIVTVVFGDVGSSTGLEERIDPEAARAVMARYHDDVTAAIEAHGGTVDKFMGDGFMATFGIPEVSEDDAARAVDAATDIQQRFAPFAADVAERFGEPITLRVGVNTGEIVVAADDVDLVGDALNVGARLEKACPPGAVLVGEETWRLTRSVRRYEPQGEVTVAGRSRPVSVYLLAAGADRGTTVGGDTDHHTPFVGREDESEALVGHFDAAVRDRGLRLATVIGSPGVGKTRLSRELRSAVAETATTFEIRCERAGSATFAPIAELVRAAAAIGEGHDATSARAAISELVTAETHDHDRLVDLLAGLVGAASVGSTEETFWGVRRLVETLAAERPVIVVIDDIQWAEPLLLDLLEHLAEWVTDAPVLVVALARPEIREIRPVLAERNRRVDEVISLEGLDTSATEKLASRLLGADLPLDLIDHLPASTEGNPLFVRELVRMLVDEEVITRVGDRWRLAIDAEAIEVPPTITSLLAARVERLDDDERHVIERAAVIGADFAAGALATLVDADRRHRLADVLERLRRKELVDATGTYWGDEPLHRFHHVLIRDAAYRRLLKQTRAELHEHVAEWIEAHAAALVGDHDEAIAFHYEQALHYRTELGPIDDGKARLGERATELLSRAAHRAMDADDLVAAGSLASRALACLPENRVAERAELLLIACEARLGSGDVDRGAVQVDQLAGLADGDPRLEAWAACFGAQLATLSRPDDLPDAEAEVTRAAERLADLGDDAGQAKAHLVRARILVLVGRIAECEIQLDLALSSARAADDSRRITAVLGNAPLAALWGPSPVPRAGGRCLDVVRLLRITTGARSVEATSMRCQAVLEALRGRADNARVMLERVRRKVERLGLRHGAMETELFTGYVELLDGQPAAAVPHLRAAYEGLAAMHIGGEASQAAALLARALLADDATAEVDELLDDAERMAGRNIKAAVAWRLARSEQLSATGAHGDAIAVLTEAIALDEGTDFVIDLAEAHGVLARVHRAAGQHEDARRAERRASDLARQKGATALDPWAAEDDGTADPAPDPRPEAQTRAAPDHEALADLGRESADRDPRLATNPLDAVVVRRCLTKDALRGDRDAAAACYRDDYVGEDRRRGLGHVYDKASAVDDLVGQWEWGDTETGVVLVVSERLALFDRRVRNADDGFESRFLLVLDVDADGLITRTLFFDDDALEDALDEIAEIHHRHCASGGHEPNEHARDDWALSSHLNLGDLDHLAAHVAADIEVEDRRHGFRDRYVGREALHRDMVEADWGRSRIYGVGLAHTLDAQLLHGFVTSPVDGGDPFQVEWLQVSRYGPDDRLSRIIRFDIDQLDAALAELAQPHELAQLGTNPLDSLVVRCTRASLDASIRGDQEATAAAVHDDYVGRDRRPGLSHIYDKAAMIDVILEQAAWGEIDVGVVAVGDDQTALFDFALRSSDGYEARYLWVQEVDEHGLAVRADTFDESAVEAAVDELIAIRDSHRESARLGAAPAHREDLLVHASLNLGDIDRAVDQCRDDIVVDSRRRGMTNRYRGREAVRADVEATHWGTWRMHGVVLDRQGRFDLVHQFFYVGSSGSTWELQYLQVTEHDEDGRTVRIVQLDVDQLDEAVAELHSSPFSSADPGSVAPTRTEGNEPSLAVTAMQTLIEHGHRLDDAAFAAGLADDFVSIDHRAGLRHEFDKDSFVESCRSIFPTGTSRTEPLLAMRRAALFTMHFDSASDFAFEVDSIEVSSFDRDGRWNRHEAFDGDRLDDAIRALVGAELRHAIEDGRAPFDLVDAEGLALSDTAIAPQRLVESGEALERGDFGAYERMLSEDFAAEDRRPGLGHTYDRDSWIDSVRAAYSTIGDRAEWRELLSFPRAVLLELHHVDAEDEGRYQVDTIQVTSFRSDSTADRQFVFESTQLDEAIDQLLAIEDEQARDDGRPTIAEVLAAHARARRGRSAALAATRSTVASHELDVLTALLEQDVNTYSARLASDFRAEDRRSGLQGEYDRVTWTENMRQILEVSPLRPHLRRLLARERVVLTDNVFRDPTDPASFETRLLNLFAFDRSGRLHHEIAFDTEDVDVAVETALEIDRRQSAEDGRSPQSLNESESAALDELRARSGERSASDTRRGDPSTSRLRRIRRRRRSSG